MSNYTQFIVLCEDRQQEVFARYFLVRCGVEQRRIRFKTSPKGHGSGEQYVRQQYPKEVKLYRSQSSHLAIGLAVMIDADTMPVERRIAQLESALENDDQRQRQAEERTAIFVPKRNIDTWIHYLQGETVNETDVYSKLDKESGCRPFVRELASKPVYRLTDSVPLSLQTACHELRRIFPEKQCEPAI